MKPQKQKVVVLGGILNLLGALFHVWLCFQIFKIFGDKPFYPLMQMLSIGGTLLIFFLAYTSLFCSTELLVTRTGRAVVLLNVWLYSARMLGEIFLFPKPNAFIIGICVLFIVIYSYIFAGGNVDAEKEKTA